MTLVSILQWMGSHKAIALVYADTFDELGTSVGETNLAAGSLSYIGNGNVYVFNGTVWTVMGE